jgi:hypothetical protein
MAKTYIPSAVDKTHALNKYFAKWSAQMAIGATPSQLLALANLVACIAAFLAEWHKPPPIG